MHRILLVLQQPSTVLQPWMRSNVSQTKWSCKIRFKFVKSYWRGSYWTTNTMVLKCRNCLVHSWMPFLPHHPNVYCTCMLNQIFFWSRNSRQSKRRIWKQNHHNKTNKQQKEISLNWSFRAFSADLSYPLHFKAFWGTFW